MYRLLTFAAAMPTALVAVPAHAAPGPKQCIGLVGKYRAEIDLASRYGALNEILSDSASPGTRAANEAREGNALTKAKMARDALRAAGCRAPALLTSSDPYLPAARRCKLDSIMSRYGGEIPTTCDPATWMRQP